MKREEGACLTGLEMTALSAGVWQSELGESPIATFQQREFVCSLHFVVLCDVEYSKKDTFISKPEDKICIIFSR